MFEPCYISSFLCGTLATTGISNQEYVRNYCKVALKRHHQIFPRTARADVIAAINLSKLKVLRFNGKIWNQISSGSFVWLVSKEEWDLFLNYLNSQPDRPTRHGKQLVYHSPASLSPKELKDFVVTFCECNKFSLDKNAALDLPYQSEVRVASPALLRSLVNDAVDSPGDSIFVQSLASSSMSPPPKWGSESTDELEQKKLLLVSKSLEEDNFPPQSPLDSERGHRSLLEDIEEEAMVGSQVAEAEIDRECRLERGCTGDEAVESENSSDLGLDLEPLPPDQHIHPSLRSRDRDDREEADEGSHGSEGEYDDGDEEFESSEDENEQVSEEDEDEEGEWEDDDENEDQDEDGEEDDEAESQLNTRAERGERLEAMSVKRSEEEEEEEEEGTEEEDEEYRDEVETGEEDGDEEAAAAADDDDDDEEEEEDKEEEDQEKPKCIGESVEEEEVEPINHKETEGANISPVSLVKEDNDKSPAAAPSLPLPLGISALISTGEEILREATNRSMRPAVSVPSLSHSQGEGEGHGSEGPVAAAAADAPLVTKDQRKKQALLKLKLLRQELQSMKREQVELKGCLSQLSDMSSTFDIVRGMVSQPQSQSVSLSDTEKRAPEAPCSAAAIEPQAGEAIRGTVVLERGLSCAVPNQGEDPQTSPPHELDVAAGEALRGEGSLAMTDLSMSLDKSNHNHSHSDHDHEEREDQRREEVEDEDQGEEEKHTPASAISSFIFAQQSVPEPPLVTPAVTQMNEDSILTGTLTKAGKEEGDQLGPRIESIDLMDSENEEDDASLSSASALAREVELNQSLLVLQGDSKAAIVIQMRPLGASPSMRMDSPLRSPSPLLGRSSTATAVTPLRIGRVRSESGPPTFPPLREAEAAEADAVGETETETHRSAPVGNERPVLWCHPSFHCADSIDNDETSDVFEPSDLSVSLTDDLDRGPPLSLPLDLLPSPVSSPAAVSPALVPPSLIATAAHTTVPLPTHAPAPAPATATATVFPVPSDSQEEEQERSEIDFSHNDSAVAIACSPESPRVSAAALFISPLIRYFEPFLRLVDPPKRGERAQTDNRTAMLWTIFQVYARADGPISSSLRITQLSRIFRDASLIPPPPAAAATGSKRKSSASSRASLSAESLRYEAAIEQCPLLMSFEQFLRFLETLTTEEPSSTASSELLSKLARLVLPSEQGKSGKYEGYWSHLLPEGYPLAFAIGSDTYSGLTPLQEESVLGDWLMPSPHSLSLSSAKPPRGIALWEKNLEQMKQLYHYYSLSCSHSNSSGSSSSSNSGNSATHRKVNLFVTFDSYRELLQDFDLFPSIVDQKVPTFPLPLPSLDSSLRFPQWLVNVYRATKLWEWRVMQQYSTSSQLSETIGSQSSKPALQHDVDRALLTLEVTFRGFLEALTRIALVISYKQNPSSSSLSVSSPTILSQTQQSHQQYQQLEGEEAGRDRRLLHDSILLMLRLMDFSSGKKKLSKSHRRSVFVRHFLYK